MIRVEIIFRVNLHIVPLHLFLIPPRVIHHFLMLLAIYQTIFLTYPHLLHQLVIRFYEFGLLLLLLLIRSLGSRILVDSQNSLRNIKVFV